MKSFLSPIGEEITYDAVREAMKGEHFDMNLKSNTEIKAVTSAVNQGIDAHLEACFLPDMGDEYELRAGSIRCKVSPHSLPTLMRRLIEDSPDSQLVSDMLWSLGIGRN